METDPHIPSAARPDADSLSVPPSAMTCQVCGHPALQAQELHEGFVQELSSRLICRVCGAHRVMNT
ncbi:hypothetical protein DFQ14_102122 [Halopolyspora algeriensis]|uniref:Uncharacterized protein n=1 Tax=Halopolyspora algeriensis TaxID=1500506 RepID=A0A368VZQ7_9ACTN|nr:hypothetical protein [Halopolyspora algeriensis]RCW45821.1 hypothetical protein DFQ14_102122 [Halopolyspora algeriensis]